MRIRLGTALASALTMGLGLITILGLLVGNDLGVLSDVVEGAGIRDFTDAILRIVTITIALTVLLGVGNLVYVHLRRMVKRQKGWFYSIVLIGSFLLVIVTYVVDQESSMVLLETVQVSVESGLAGLMFFALVFGAYRMMQHRVTWTGTLFVTVVLVILAGAIPLSSTEQIQDLRDWLLEIPVSAGARGLLLGIALATVVTGVRVLIGIDRSYRD